MAFICPGIELPLDHLCVALTSDSVGSKGARVYDVKWC